MSASWMRSSAVWGTDGGGGSKPQGSGFTQGHSPMWVCCHIIHLCVSHCQTIKDTVRNVQPHAAVQSSSFAAVACWDTWNCKFILIQMWREGVLAQQTSCIYGILQYFICVVCRFLPVRLSATLWHHPHWDEYRSSSGVAPHRAQAPRICWTWRTSGSPADRTGAPRTPALSSASEGLLKVQERMLKHWQGLISPLVWNIVGEIIRDMCCFPSLDKCRLEIWMTPSELDRYRFRNETWSHRERLNTCCGSTTSSFYCGRLGDFLCFSSCVS